MSVFDVSAGAVLLFPLNRAIPPARPTDTGVSAKKAPIHASAPIDEATEKSRPSQPWDQGSPDHRQAKRTPVNKPDRVGWSFEPGSRVTDASDLHSEKQP
jgi:hypothetical protein